MKVELERTLHIEYAFPMTSQDFLNLDLPDAPGVYFFKGPTDILYIGRATSLRDRVRSYFGDELMHTRGPLLVDMVTQATTIEWQETGSVLEAIILEANLIKEHQPHFNTKEKDNRSFNYVVITEEEFPRVLLVRGRNLEKTPASDAPYTVRETFGPFPQGSTLREALKIIRKIFPYRDTCTPQSGKPCFNRQIGLCPGVCTGEVDAKTYAKTIHRITLFLRGKVTVLLAELERDMNAYAKVREFEKAEEMKRTLYALSHIQDIALIKETGRDTRAGVGGNSPLRGFRIEAYDIAHLGGAQVVGVMTVVTDGIPDKAEYRKFKIKSTKSKSGSGNDDVNNLKEILARRFGRTEWGMPDLIVVDGGVAQRNAAEKILNELSITIPIVSVVKDDRHVARDVLGEVSHVDAYRASILLANSEAHRFAITYHKLLRKKAFLKGVIEGLARKS